MAANHRSRRQLNPVTSCPLVRRIHGSFVAGSYERERVESGEVHSLTLVATPGEHTTSFRCRCTRRCFPIPATIESFDVHHQRPSVSISGFFCLVRLKGHATFPP